MKRIPYTNDISSSTKNNSVVWLTNDSHVQLQQQQHELLNPDPYCMGLGDNQSYFDLSSAIASPLSSSSAAAAAAEGYPGSELAVSDDVTTRGLLLHAHFLLASDEWFARVQ
jgi:hypothetical protein